MRIIDCNGKEREVLSLKRASHSHKDIDGNEIVQDFVEVVIQGKVRTWTNWYPLDKFRLANPEVRI